MATTTTYSVDEARALLPAIRSVLLQVAVARRNGGDEETQGALLEHLEALGVAVRDLDAGLVDIPSIRDGERVWLCWRLADPEIGWWHTTREGFSSRRRL